MPHAMPCQWRVTQAPDVRSGQNADSEKGDNDVSGDQGSSAKCTVYLICVVGSICEGLKRPDCPGNTTWLSNSLIRNCLETTDRCNFSYLFDVVVTVLISCSN